jgi:hypothetical protein
MAPFTADAHFAVYMDPQGSEAFSRIAFTRGACSCFRRAEQIRSRNALRRPEQSSLCADEPYCLAHHVKVDDGKRRLMVASLRYIDTLVKTDDAWLFAERLFYVDSMDERALP